jgi:hypothetical protein
MNMRNWSKVDLSKVDLAALSAEDRDGLYAEVKRRAHVERAKALRDSFGWLRRIFWQPRRRPDRTQAYAAAPRGPRDLIFGGRV